MSPSQPAGVTQETIEESRSAVERVMLNDIHRLVKEGVDLNTPLDHSATLVRGVLGAICAPLGSHYLFHPPSSGKELEWAPFQNELVSIVGLPVS